MADNDTQGKAEPGSVGAPRRKRRWRRRILIAAIGVAVVLIVLVVLAPYLLSTDAGTRFVIGQLNDSIKGRASVADLSTSWGGPTEIRSLHLVDLQGREVLVVGKAVYSGGAWQMIKSAVDFSKVTLDSPQVVLYLDADGNPSIAEALSPRNPSPPSDEPSKPWNRQSRQVIVAEGLVRVVRQDGASYELNHLAVDADLATLQSIKAKLQCNSPEGVKLSGDADLVDLLSAEGDLQLERANIQGKLRSDGPLDLAALAAVMSPGMKLAGKAGIDVTANVSQGQGPLNLNLAFKGLHAAQAGAAQINPIDLDLRGTVNLARQSLSGSLVAQSDAVKGNFEFLYPTNQQVRMPSDMLAAVMLGRQVAMPEFMVKGAAHLDLARLQQAMPTLLGTRKDVQFTGGAADLSQFTVSGGKEPKAVLSCKTSDVQGRSGTGQFRLEPITGEFNVALREGVGLVLVKPAKLTAQFATLQAEGTAADLTASYAADLQKLAAQLGQIADVGSLTLSGNITGKTTAKRGRDRNVAIASEARGENLSYTGGGKSVSIGSLLARREGVLEVVDNRPTKFTLRTDHVEIGDQAAIDTTGWYDFRDSSFSFAGELTRADLAKLGTTLSGLGMRELARFGGTMTGKATMSRPSAHASVKGEADFSIRSPRVGGKALTRSDGPIRFTIAGLAINPDTGAFNVDLAKLVSDFVNVTVQEFRTGPGGDVAGQYTLQGDLRPMMTVVSIATDTTDLPDIAGAMNGSGSLRTQENALAIVGSYGFNNVVLRREGKTISQPRITLDYSLTIQRDADRLNLRQFQFRSTPLDLDLTGDITKLSRDKVLNLDAHYKGSWEKILQLLHQFAPSTAETIALQGQPEDRFKITGSAYNPSIAGYYGVAAKPSVNWTQARMFGLQMEQARLTPSLENGFLRLPRTTIPGVSGGRANVAFDMDLRGQTKVLRVPGHLKVLDNFVVNKDVGKHILSRINPVLGQVSQMSGRVVLETDDLVLPLGPEIKRRSSGRAMLDLSNMQVVPEGVLGDLMKLTGLGRAQTYALSIQRVNLSLDNGRISYDRFVIRILDFDWVFRGWVDFDDNVNLVVSIPLTPALLSELRIPGLPKGALNLDGLRVDIPLRGKRWAPTLDLKAIDSGKILKDILKQGGGLLKPFKLP